MWCAIDPLPPRSAQVRATRHFFDPTPHVGIGGVRHLVIGTSGASPGVLDEAVEELRDFMCDVIIVTLF